MKYIISESRFNSAMVKFFEKEMPPEELKYYNLLTTDEDDNEYESNDAFAFYKEDDEEDAAFKYYTCEYFDEGVEVVCPLISLEYYYQWKFDDMFGELWRPVFLAWANERFELDAKSID